MTVADLEMPEGEVSTKQLVKINLQKSVWTVAVIPK